jgi:hypothetical protein
MADDSGTAEDPFGKRRIKFTPRGEGVTRFKIVGIVLYGLKTQSNHPKDTV